MPYGAVMATGAASQLTPLIGLSSLRLPLLALAATQALLIPIAGRMRGVPLTALTRRPSPGAFTVPIGLMVVATGLAEQPGTLAHIGAWSAFLPGWLSTLALFGSLTMRYAGSGSRMPAFDGTWFLAPAALLAGAIATASILPSHPWLPLAACTLGVFGYLTMLVIAAAHLRRVGIPKPGTPRVSWWVGAGCAGLAAAAIGRTAPQAADHTTMPIAAAAVVVLWAIGSALLIPVLAASVHHLHTTRGQRGIPPWPPTFSMGVYALGASHAGRLSLPAATILADAAAACTLLFWAYTIGPHVYSTLHDLHHHRRSRHR